MKNMLSYCYSGRGKKPNSSFHLLYCLQTDNRRYQG
ncbi:unnamed protein product [Brassica rapa]|uniref:Uncharacterized protein n=1 Tax=Brassica campestris TaxID=3711 RepID=A0A8D9H6C5_BRACM|nr:unnamed protein product [Brassica rapa]